jgi:Ca2+-transporting ATPase
LNDASTAQAAAVPVEAGATHPPHAQDVDRVLEELTVDPSRGLSSKEVETRLARYGPNRLPDPPKKSVLSRLFGQFANPLVLTLLLAAVIALGVGLSNGGEQGFLTKFGDAIAILLIVIVNAVLGFVQESRAEAALESLKSMTAPTARVRRNSEVSVVNASDLVPGDMLEMEAGDFVPADARLMQTIDFAAEEAALTGESSATVKDARQPLADDAPLAERVTMVFLGTTVVRGKGRAVVVATGPRTELGKIGEMISRTEKEKTPLEMRLESFGRRILWACLGISLLLFAWGVVKGGRAWHELLLEAVSFAVAAIPEGLPAITTITLALGMQRMAKKGAVVRKLLAVETLGAASIICTDKTGTLTQNEMTVRLVYASRTRYRVTGEGYDPRGHLQTLDGTTLEKLPSTLDYLLATAALCTNARLDLDNDTHQWKVIGDPTEGALLTLAAKGGRDKESVAISHTVVRELPFDSDRKRMTVVTLDQHGREVAHVKGSLDVLLPLCEKIASDDGVRAITDEDRALVQGEADRMSADALRVLAIARRVRPTDNPEEALTLLGIVGMKDPPRSGVKEAIRICQDAGVRIVMITGDHPITAVAIAHELDLWTEGDEAVTGSLLSKMSDDDLRAKAMRLRVFARTTAEQKLRIVNAYRALGHVVAMTGDGVNDAPALKQAHIGVAMGRSGTDVARQAADLVLADDNFATIVDAVREGRSIYRNIQKFIFFLLSSNAGLAVAVFVVSFIKGALPPTPLQILWINLVTNGLPALALGVDPADPGHMKEQPRPAQAGLLGVRDFIGVGFVGVFMGLCAASLYVFPPAAAQGNVGFVRAMAFSLLALSPLFHAFSCRSPIRSIFTQRPFLSLPLLGACLISAGVHLVAVLVPSLRPVFRTFPMDQSEWLLVIGLSFAIIPAVELMKAFGRMRQSLVKVVVVALLFIPFAARADGIAIRPDLVKAGEIKLDGIPREWSTALTPLSKTVSGSPSADLGMRGTIAYDETNLYVAAEFKDDRLVRTAACGESEDHASLLLAFPRGGGAYALHEVNLFPGDPGKAAGCVRMKGGGSIAGAKIVEAPKGVPGAYSFEALIPWSAFAEAARTRVGMRAALRYYDGDGRAIKTILGTSTDVPPADLPRLSIEAEQSLEDGLLKEKGISSSPTHDRFADVAGDAMLERVVVYDRYLAVLGPHFREGKEYYYGDLGVDVNAGQMPMFEVRDVNGDGKAEIVTRKRVGSAAEWREMVAIMSMGPGDVPFTMFQHEVGIHGPVGTITNEIRFSAGGAHPTIEISPGTAIGYNAANYREAVETSMDPLLLPWGTIKTQVYEWNGKAFAKVREEKQAPSSAGPTSKSAANTEAPRAVSLPPVARPPTPDEMQDQVYGLYKRERHVGHEKPRFDFAVDLADDARKERMLLHGRDLVVFGKGFKGGAGYAFLTLEQFSDPRDIADINARDITDDGKAEIFVRGVIHAPPPKDAGLKPGMLVDREVMLVYAVTPQGIARVFGVETGRSIGGKRVQGTLAFLPGARGLDIEVRPGRAFGFTDRTYPFGQEQGKQGGLEPLLLPWSGAAIARYHWDGSGFVR